MISAKKCVTTYLPNELALKIDDAKAIYLNITDESKKKKIRRVGKRGDNKKVFEVIRYEVFSSADLGSSSKYSSENLEGRSGERFHENSI